MTGGNNALVATLHIFETNMIRRFFNSRDTYTTLKTGLGSAVLGIFNLVTLYCTFVNLFLYTKC